MYVHIHVLARPILFGKIQSPLTVMSKQPQLIVINAKCITHKYYLNRNNVFLFRRIFHANFVKYFHILTWETLIINNDEIMPCKAGIFLSIRGIDVGNKHDLNNVYRLPPATEEA